jgi:hypothetical protein
MTPRSLDGVAVGQTFRSGPWRIDHERLKCFAAEFDPQAFHLDYDGPSSSSGNQKGII